MNDPNSRIVFDPWENTEHSPPPTAHEPQEAEGSRAAFDWPLFWTLLGSAALSLWAFYGMGTAILWALS
jgi:hypothetical protein